MTDHYLALAPRYPSGVLPVLARAGPAHRHLIGTAMTHPVLHLATSKALGTSPCGHMRRVITTWAGDPSSLIGQHVDLDDDTVRVLEAATITDCVPYAVGLTVHDEAPRTGG